MFQPQELWLHNSGATIEWPSESGRHLDLALAPEDSPPVVKPFG
jgi:hypothetical protein